MTQRYTPKPFWALAAISLASCTFDSVPALNEPTNSAQTSQAGKTGVAKSMSGEPAVKAMSMRTSMAAIGRSDAAGAPAVSGGRALDAGTHTASVMSDAAVGGSAKAGSSAAAAAGAHARRTPDAGRSRPGNGQNGSNKAMPAAMDSGAAKRCPWFPSQQDESFCYDFENGALGPNGGTTYDLWSTPELPLASQLSILEQSDMTQNHLLRTLPSLSATETCAAVSHSTSHFDSATVEFDLWANAALLEASDAVSCFRFVPVDGDYNQVTAIYFRRGEAVLRSESSATEYTLRQLPKPDQPTHVRVHLVRGSSCSVEVQFDGELVGSAPAGTCAREDNSFVEFGLYMLDRASGPMSAYFDNISFTRE